MLLKRRVNSTEQYEQYAGFVNVARNKDAIDSAAPRLDRLLIGANSSDMTLRSGVAHPTVCDQVILSHKQWTRQSGCLRTGSKCARQSVCSSLPIRLMSSDQTSDIRRVSMMAFYRALKRFVRIFTSTESPRKFQTEFIKVQRVTGHGDEPYVREG